jgi:hypothetical protein
MSATWIAEQRVVFVHLDGTRHEGRIAVGTPVPGPQDAQCPVALDVERTGPILGDRTLQALLRANRFLGMRLHDFMSRGGRVLCPNDEADVALDARFGPGLRGAEPHDGSKDG